MLLGSQLPSRFILLAQSSTEKGVFPAGLQALFELSAVVGPALNAHIKLMMSQVHRPYFHLLDRNIRMYRSCPSLRRQKSSVIRFQMCWRSLSATADRFVVVILVATSFNLHRRRLP